MSSLIFYTDTDQALVATDTLGVTPNGDPVMFSSKAVYLPHLRTIIVGTGAGTFSGDWAMMANNRMVLSGICNLDYHAPQTLRDRWAEFKAEGSMPDHVTTTVYHFGFSEEDQTMHAYAYRSTNKLKSERIQYGNGLKPACQIPDALSLVEALPVMMREQRETEDAKPVSERLFIGGECIAIHLTRENCSIAPIFKFDDFSIQAEQVVRNHASD